MDDTIPKLKTEAALKGLAALKDTNAGRPRKRVEGEETKLPHENDTGETKDSSTQMAAGELASEFEISVDDVISPPSEVVDFRQSLEAEKPDVLRGRLTKAAFENKGLRRWINQVMKQLQEAKRGGNVSIVAPPSGLLPEAAGVSDDSEGALKVLKAMAPYLMIKDLFKEDSGEDGKSQSQGMIKYESPEGEKFEYPAGSFPPGYNPFFGSGKQGKEDGDEKTVTVKIGDNEITGPPSYVNAMVPMVIAQQRQGEDGSGGTKALEQVIELQKMMLEQQRGNGKQNEEKEEKMITVIEEDGKSVEIPASVYPQYMMMQSVVKQQKMFMEQQRQLQRGSRGSSEGGSSTRESATVYAALAKMNDIAGQMAAAIDPERLGANAVKGLKNKLEEWNEIRAFVGGGGEDSEVMKERIKEQEGTRRKELEENTKLAREIEKTKQAELDARKFDMLMNPQPWQTMPQQQVQQALEEEEPRVTEEEAFAHSKEVNKRFLEEIEEERSEGLEGEEE